jgi:putative ABC transport system permease protein
VSVELAEALGLAVGDSLRVGAEWWAVAGIFSVRTGAASLQIFIPFEAASLVWPDVSGGPVERILLDVGEVEAVPAVVDSTRSWVARRFPDGAVDVLANRTRVEQVRQAMLVFKLLMGAIAGISLIVGGIGIMNVLLASVTERTREIGVRKAVGARQRDILVQFLTEAVAVTGAGSAFGLLLGIGTAHIVAVFMRRQTEAEVFPVLTGPTILVAISAAVTVGLVFGLYPALRAARLSPIEAIRHE